MSNQTMLQLISAYLYRYGHCPLPGLGTLFMSTEPARVLHGEHKIAAPKQTIEFKTDQQPADRLIEFISEIRNIPVPQAKKALEVYCQGIKMTVAGSADEIRGPGNFHVDQDGELVFIPAAPSDYFQPDVTAERVIHPNDSHQMLVGDRETTNTRMTEYFTEVEPERRSRWWIAALVIFLAAMAMIVFYMQGGRGRDMFGNSGSVNPKTESTAYQAVP